MTNVTLPQAVALELTYRCNHRCVFCSCPWYYATNAYPLGQELTLELWRRAIDILFENGVKAFSISGGEATLNESMPEIVDYIHKGCVKRGYNTPIVLISNGLLMNEKYLKLFSQSNVNLSMSLPGYETFATHTTVDNADGVLQWFRRAKEMGITTTLNVTVTAKNIHELFETISMGLISGASSLLLNRFLPGGRGLYNKDDLLLNNEQINEMLDIAEEVLTLSNRYGSLGTEIPMCVVKERAKYKRLNIGYKCAAAKGFFVVDPAGYIRVCNHSTKIVGNIFDTPMIGDIDYWNTFALSRYKPNVCSDCRHIDRCDASCREVACILNGSPSAIDPTVAISKL